MDLSNDTLMECISVINREKYEIIYGKQDDQYDYVLLYLYPYVCDFNISCKTNNEYYKCSVEYFVTLDDLLNKLNVYDAGIILKCVLVFYKESNITNTINTVNKCFLEKGENLNEEYIKNHNLCVKCQKNTAKTSCDMCLKFKICYECYEYRDLHSCKCGCKLKSCDMCLKNNKFLKCCGENYYYKKHKIEYCRDCFYRKLIEMSKLELLDITKNYLMELIANNIDILNYNDKCEEADELEKHFINHKNFYIPHEISYCNYKDSQRNELQLYIWTGFILDNKLPDNDMYVKKHIIKQYINIYDDFHNILSLEDMKKYCT